MEENPNTKLSKPYQGKLINKLKDNFSTEEQQLFISSFYLYLNYKSDEFIIDLDDIWTWLGFTRKDNTKRLLEKYFKPDIDFKIVFLRSEENTSIGRPSEKIMLNIKTFKKFCLKANTSKANEIHEYYIKLEETLHEVIDEESNELRLQLEMKDEIIQKKDELIEQKDGLIEKKDEKIKKLQRETQVVDGRNVCYLCTSEEKESEGIYTVGKASNLKNRLDNYNGNKLSNFKMVYYISCKSVPLMDAIEKIILSKLNIYLTL
jgi:phage anti-repressor protein